MEPLHPFAVYKVLLMPRLDIVLRRNAERTNKHFETAALAEIITTLHTMFAGQEHNFRTAGWLVVDSTDLTLEDTAAHVLSRASYG